MNFLRFIPKFTVYLALAGLVAISWWYWPPYLNFIWWAGFLLRLAVDIRIMLIRLFDFSRRALRTFLLAVFAALLAVSAPMGAVAVFFGLTAWSVFPVLAGLGLIVSWGAGKRDNLDIDYPFAELADPDKAVLDEVPAPFLAVLGFLVLTAVGFFLLFSSRTGAVLSSPWQTIRPEYIWIFLLATFMLGLLILSNLKAKFSLFLIALHSFLSHSYLALTHTLMYGADGWRHVAVEKWLSAGTAFFPPSLAGGAPVALDFGRFAYAQFWGLALLVNKFLNFSFLQINAWLAPVFWSVVGVIILFEIGRALGWSKKYSLFLAWIGFLPFSLQVAGAFTLPVNLGLLWFLFGLLLILKRIKQPAPGQRAFLAMFLILSLFGYSLYVVFFILVWVLAELHLFGFGAHRKIIIGAAVLSAILLPVLELSVGYAVPQKIYWWQSVKQMAGNFSGWYLASGPRPHDIATGNILFNQTPMAAFFPNPLTSSLWWLAVGAFVIYFLLFFGWDRAWRYGRPGERILAVLFLSVLGGYVISGYFLGGERMLSRRLDALFGVLLLLFLITAVKYLLEKFFGPADYKKWILAVLILVASLVGAAGYSLGPDTVAVGVDEYSAMNYIWQREKTAGRWCVIADAYPLLALEAISARRVVGGGFPINQYFAQPERVLIYNSMLAEVKNDLWQSARLATGGDTCYLVAPRVSVESLSGGAFPGLKIFGRMMVGENAGD